MLIESKNFIPRRSTVPYAVSFFIVAGIIVTAAFFSFRNNLTSSFKPVVAEYEKSVQDAILAQQAEAEKTLKEMTADDDLDGISNYEETNVHNTSPYLSDSDSDGLSDKYEIDTGTDPLCPSGQECTKSPSLLFPNAPSVKEDNSNYTAEDIEGMREVLRAVPGIDLDQLASLNDTDVIGAYEEFRDFSGQIDASGVTTLFNELGADGIKQKLIESGFPKEEVEKLDTDQLKALLDQSFESLSF